MSTRADHYPDWMQLLSRRGALEFYRAIQPEVLDVLSPRERRVLDKRMTSPTSMTLEALGTELGVTGARVRQIEQRALRKLQRQIEIDRRKGLI